MEVVEVTVYSDDALKAVNSLLRQLSDSAAAVTEHDLRRIIESDASRLLVAVENGWYCGMLTLVVFRTPTGMRAWIEDVVVDSDARRRGVGRLLTAMAVELAKASGARSVDLTSRPSREAANELYKAMGFEQRQTNVYRLKTAGDREA